MSGGKLDSAEALSHHLEALLVLDPRLRAVKERAGPFSVRKTEGGFAGLARVICGQQLSIQSAAAIWSRFEALPGSLEPVTYLQLDEGQVRRAGFSLGKYQTLRRAAEAAVSGDLDFAVLEVQPADAAVAALSRIKGIGPWTAEIYLMFCAGHPDIFPSGDLALQKAAAHALSPGERLPARELADAAQAWAPHRSTAALLFWRYYAAMRQRESLPL